jgi:hypothetical protein
MLTMRPTGLASPALICGAFLDDIGVFRRICPRRLNSHFSKASIAFGSSLKKSESTAVTAILRPYPTRAVCHRGTVIFWTPPNAVPLGALT